MKGFLPPLLRSVRNILFPCPPHKQDIPRIYEVFIKHFAPFPQTHCGITFFLQYKNPSVKNLIEELKRYNNTLFFYFTGRIIASYLVTKKISDSNIYLIPIPQTKNRLRKRGYDVTKNISRAIRENTQPIKLLDGSDFLEHTRTLHQSGFTHRRERLESAEGMFRITRKVDQISAGSPCILIDDVCTTGASMNEAEKILQESGWVVLEKITLAHS